MVIIHVSLQWQTNYLDKTFIFSQNGKNEIVSRLIIPSSFKIFLKPPHYLRSNPAPFDKSLGNACANFFGLHKSNMVLIVVSEKYTKR